MKLTVIFLFLFLYVFQSSLVESGILFDKIKTGISDTGHKIKCGVHKLGGLITQNQDSSCDENGQDEKNNEIDTDEKPGKKGNFFWDKCFKNSNTYCLVGHDVTAATAEKVTKKTTDDVSVTTESTRATVSQGRRVISVGANCPEGYRGDGKGNCREEY
jgi:hypothetical protein